MTHLEPGPYVRLTVSDTGRGLAAHEIPLLFRPFSQVHRPGEVPERGTGLGLFIVRGIMEAHGGTVRVDSTPAIGTRVTVVLPAPEGPFLDTPRRSRVG